MFFTILLFLVTVPYLSHAPPTSGTAQRKMKTRKVYPGEVHHVCQQTIDEVLIFYTVSDYLVFFTIICTVARRYGIKVLAMCPMVDHTHQVVVVPSESGLSGFVQQYTHLFSREWNRSRGRTGSLFKHRYMSSVKLGNKQARTLINYNNNNPVERKLVERAEEYRWNFLRYAKEKSPFSEPLKLSDKSALFRNILKEVDGIFKGDGHLQYRQLERWKKYLGQAEMQQLSDYIIHRWNVIDYDSAVAYYGDFDAMLRSCHDNTGSDYDIKEDRNHYSDAVYQECTRLLLKSRLINHPYEIPCLPIEKKRQLEEYLHYRTSATPRQLQKYLHLPRGK